jgi:hypothetical protein
MITLINKILESNKQNSFEFHSNTIHPVRHLKEQTRKVPENPGLYLVFTQNSKAVSNSKEAHLNFQLNNMNHELLYFGKAGGVTANGKLIKQGLNGRINNVVSESSRNLKDIKRANYWNIIMNELEVKKFKVLYTENPNHQALEDTIYDFLDQNKLKYPLMNKKRGRK